MGLAMRVARYLPIVVATGLVCQAAIPLTSCASDSASIDTSERSPEPQSTGRYPDDAVQQAGYYDARTNTNSTPNMQPAPGANQQKRTVTSKSWFGRPTQTQNGRPANNASQIPGRSISTQ